MTLFVDTASVLGEINIIRIFVLILTSSSITHTKKEHVRHNHNYLQITFFLSHEVHT
jgi:hypothetical protein